MYTSQRDKTNDVQLSSEVIPPFTDHTMGIFLQNVNLPEQEGIVFLERLIFGIALVLFWI